MFITIISNDVVYASNKLIDDGDASFDEAVKRWPTKEVHLIWVDGHRSEVHRYSQGRTCEEQFCKNKALFAVETYEGAKKHYTCNTCLPTAAKRKLNSQVQYIGNN